MNLNSGPHQPTLPSQRSENSRFLPSCTYILLALDLLTGIAHLLWPELDWGQGRSSYFNFNNSLTLASWLVGMQMLLAGLVALATAHYHKGESTGSIWMIGGVLLISLSIAETTRLHERLELLGYPDPGVYEFLVIVPLGLILLGFFGWRLYRALEALPSSYRRAGLGWIILWGSSLLLQPILDAVPPQAVLWVGMVSGLTYLTGSTLLLTAVVAYLFAKPDAEAAARTRGPEISSPSADTRIPVWLLPGVAGAAFVQIFLQSVFFQLFTIFSDYQTANFIIPVALLGTLVAGVIASRFAHHYRQAIVVSSLGLPFTILLGLGAVISLAHWPLAAAALLMTPFVCTGVILSLVLTRFDSHAAYFIMLLGAGVGALAVNPALSNWREEGTLWWLAGLTCLLGLLAVQTVTSRQSRLGLSLLTVVGAFSFSAVGAVNSQADLFNAVRVNIQSTHPAAQVLFTRSSVIGRYDVVRLEPDDVTLKTYENGRVSDTIRPFPVEEHQIDPRLPGTLIENPSILIIGVSGDAVTKSARFLSNDVDGVEINPDVVALQTQELVTWNANSYAGIDVTILDGRSYLDQSIEDYDIITLLNTHFARGGTIQGRSVSPEYLYTLEAMTDYLDHLTEQGVLSIEEPVNRPDRELPVWKLLLTMREALMQRGSRQPDQHFFIFQWRTDSNNYIQILMKRTPFTDDEVARLTEWLWQVDHLEELEQAARHRLGPIQTARTTLLHSPRQPTENNASRVVRGEVDEELLRLYNLQPITDDRPFMFDVDPARYAVKSVYGLTVCIVLALALVGLRYFVDSRSFLYQGSPYLLLVILTGLGYLIVEVSLMQRFERFLGSPTAAFTVVLGTLLFSSGIGSFWSRRFKPVAIAGALGAALILLLVQQFLVPQLFAAMAVLPLASKVGAAVLTLAPLGFVLGIPFPSALRLAKVELGTSPVPMLYAFNAGASALAVPLTFNLSMRWGFQTTATISMALYATAAVLLIAMHQAGKRTMLAGLTGFGVTILLAAPWFPSSRPLSQTASYEIYGISYGHSMYQEQRVLLGGSSTKQIPFEWLFWIIHGEDRIILVDTGFTDPELAERWGLTSYHNPLERLHQLGISPGDIDDIVLTHAHWDHMGGLAAYPNARIWLQQTEYDYATSLVGPSRPSVDGIRWLDVANLSVAEMEGRLSLVQGVSTIAPGITVRLAGGHTPGSQYVVVDTPTGPVIIAGDNTYLYRNSQSHLPVGSAVDRQANLSAIEVMHQEAASMYLILPGHDPLVLDYFRAVSEGIVQIVPLQ